MRAGTCVHFTGIQHHACKACVPYATVMGTGLHGLPCIHANSGPGCDSYLEPTAEQIAEHDTKVKASLARFLGVMPAVNEWRAAQGWSKKNRVSASGTVPCGACGTGTIHLSMAGCNGHVWGKCTTVGCVEWVE